MPKMRTHRGAAKRFRVTGTGKVIRKKAYNSHLFTGKSSKRKRSLEREVEVSPADSSNVRKILGIGMHK
ncbi:50S ribosomal protein L35 [Candidatus Bathyarchaeota archaeon]|nr:50S ribosomal protein L35 [Candidatus Bathyarchaeota archaeon]